MAMPNPFQKLKHGALLCKKNFSTFVETFNFLVDFSQNIRGDGDNNCNGTIFFDRSVPDHPVIRSKINMAYPMSGASGADANGRFKIESIVAESSNQYVVTMTNCYYRVGGKTYDMGDRSVTVAAGHIVAAKIGMTSSSTGNSVTTYASMSAMNNAESDTAYYIMPLYKFDSNFNVECDFRIGPDAAAWEIS